jgi:hypothetical protein
VALTLDFAFEGFRIIRERPKLILFWAPVLLLSQVISAGILILMAGPEFMAIMDMYNKFGFGVVTDHAAEYANLAQKVTPAFGAGFLVSMFFSAIVLCAVYRAVLGIGDDRYGYLKFGKDELRQIAISFLLLVFAFVVSIVFTIGLIIVGGILVALTQATMGAPAITFGFVSALVSVAFYLWLVIRLSLVPVQSFDEKRLNFRGSFRLTKGHFWQLLLGYVVTIIMIMLVQILCEIIFVALAVPFLGLDMGGADMRQTFDLSRLESLANPVVAGYMIMSALRAPLLSALLIGAQAAAYKSLKPARTTT